MRYIVYIIGWLKGIWKEGVVDPKHFRNSIDRLSVYPLQIYREKKYQAINNLMQQPDVF